MPRYKPPTQRAKQDERQKLRQAAEPDSRLIAAATLLEEVRVERGITQPITTRDRPVYGPGSEHSYFRDLAASVADDQHADWMPHPLHGGGGEARARLATVERRTLSTVATVGGDFALNFTPTSAPGYVGAAFAAAVRNKARLAQLLHHQPLPDLGVKIETPRITTGTTATVQTADNVAASEQDIVEALVTSNMATILGQQNLSQQLLDHANPAAGIDVVLGTDLGNAIGAQLDSQCLYGTGANGQLRGFVNVSGITTVTKNNIAPTGATNLAAIGNLAASTAAAYGALPDTIAMLGRRLAFITSNNVGGFRWPVSNVVEVPSIRATDGGSTNQDEAWAFTSDEVWLFGGQPSFRVMFDQSGSSTMTVKFVASMYVGLLAHRQPASIGRLVGTEFVAPPNY